MVRHIDPLHPVIERYHRVFRGGDTLDHQWDFILVLDQLHGAPFQSLLEVAAGGTDAALTDISLGDIAFAPAVMCGVHSQAERRIAIINRAADDIFDEGIVATYIELID